MTIDDAAWRRVVRHPEALVARAALAAIREGAAHATKREGAAHPAIREGAVGPASVVLTGDSTLKRLNARHRGRNKATNVLTFDAGREILLALGTVRREARAARRRPAHHLAHLVVHGALHLQGHDHDHPGDARRMEMAETRILARLGLPDPWRRA